MNEDKKKMQLRIKNSENVVRGGMFMGACILVFTPLGTIVIGGILGAIALFYLWSGVEYKEESQQALQEGTKGGYGAE